MLWTDSLTCRKRKEGCTSALVRKTMPVTVTAPSELEEIRAPLTVIHRLFQARQEGEKCLYGKYGSRHLRLMHVWDTRHAKAGTGGKEFSGMKCTCDSRAVFSTDWRANAPLPSLSEAFHATGTTWDPSAHFKLALEGSWDKVWPKSPLRLILDGLVHDEPCQPPNTQFP